MTGARSTSRTASSLIPLAPQCSLASLSPPGIFRLLPGGLSFLQYGSLRVAKLLTRRLASSRMSISGVIVPRDQGRSFKALREQSSEVTQYHSWYILLFTQPWIKCSEKKLQKEVNTRRRDSLGESF